MSERIEIRGVLQHTTVGREPYEMRLSDAAVAAHELAERGEDEPDLDLQSLARAMA